jgi:N-acetylmuramoyl-L-alanine amidase/putative methionine-R-sulfoxide reductase with GAF domain
MATIPTKPDIAAPTPLTGASGPVRVRSQAADPIVSTVTGSDVSQRDHAADVPPQKPSQRDALQALLAFSSLHDQVRRRKALTARNNGFDAVGPAKFEPEFEQHEQFILDEVLQLVAERAVAITGADGLAIALAENNEIVLRAAAGAIRPDVGARIDRDSAFSGACFRAAQTVICDDTETDPKVNVAACRKLGARSMVAVPLCGRRRVIGVLEAFSEWPFAFNESDVRNLTLLAELVLGALKPEDEDRFAESAQAAATRLDPASRVPQAAAIVAPPKVPAVTTPANVTAKLPNIAPASTPNPIAQVPVATTAATVPIVPAAVPGVATKASEPKLSSIPVPPILGKSAPKAADVLLAAETAAAPESAAPEVAVSEIPAPELATQDAESQRRPVMLVLLACIVIGTALAGGVWWKMKRDLGSTMIHMEKMPVKSDATDSSKDLAKDGARDKDVPAAPLPPPANSNAAADATSDASEPDSSVPASAQELSKFPRVTGIRHWSSADSSTVVLDLQDQVQYEAHRLAGPDRIYFDLRDTQLAADLVGKSIEVGDTFIGRIRMAQPVAGMTRIVLETKANSTFSVSLEPNPYRLVVEVRKIGSNPKGAVNLFPNPTEAEKNKLAIVVPPPTKEDIQLRARVPKMRIVVDAGHGGWDLGTVGRRGLLEKDLVLEIAQRLGKLLESRLGTEVIYTRQDDNYIPLDERASIANQAQADLFISVHANYSDLPSARGVETYYTNFFSAPGSKEIGSKEAGAKDDAHATTAAAAKPATLITLSASDLHERIEQSRRLATSVQHSLYGTLSVQNPGLRDRGIKEAGFVVLTESAMPGILAEVSFVSSPTDEQKLRSDGYREQIAEALYKGIARYAATSHSVKVAAK